MFRWKMRPFYHQCGVNNIGDMLMMDAIQKVISLRPPRGIMWSDGNLPPSRENIFGFLCEIFGFLCDSFGFLCVFWISLRPSRGIMWSNGNLPPSRENIFGFCSLDYSLSFFVFLGEIFGFLCDLFWISLCPPRGIMWSDGNLPPSRENIFGFLCEIFGYLCDFFGFLCDFFLFLCHFFGFSCVFFVFLSGLHGE